MDKREEGFTLIELMITMVIFVLVIAGASSIFTGLLTQFKQQSKITETNIEGAVGLEILRRDLESAGYGLAWNVEIDNTESPGDGNDWEQLVEYCEAISVPPNPLVIQTTHLTLQLSITELHLVIAPQAKQVAASRGLFLVGMVQG